LISLYFTRKVFNIGPLKSKAFRFLLLFVLAAIIGMFTFLVFLFFKDIGNTKFEVQLILKVYGMTISFWTLIIFLFVKILFMKSNNFLKMTTTLPVSMNERNTALLIFETLISIVVITLLSSAIVLALLLVHGMQFIFLLFSTIYFSSIITYLGLQLMDKILVFFLNLLNLNYLKDIFTIFLFSGLFFVLYKEANSVIESIVSTYLGEQGPEFHILTIWPMLFDQFGFGLVLMLFVLLFLLLCFSIIKIPDTGYMSVQNYLKIEISKSFNNLLGSYVYSILRKKDTISYIGVSYVIFIFLYIDQKEEYILYSLFPLAFNGIYQYVNTNSVRKLWWKTNYTVLKDYLLLVGSQFFYIFLIAIPPLVTILFFKISVDLLAIPSLLLAVFLFTLMGILFPPYDDNPFSVITSLIIIFTISIVLLLGLGILQLSNFQNTLIIFFIFIVIVYFSILGLSKIKEEL